MIFSQIKAIKQVSGSLKVELANYREMLSFAQFGSDLDASTKAVLDHGAKVMEILKQDQYSPLSVYDQVLSLFAIKFRFIKNVPLSEDKRYESEVIAHIHEKHPEIVEELVSKKAISSELEALMKEVYTNFTNDFVNTLGK